MALQYELVDIPATKPQSRYAEFLTAIRDNVPALLAGRSLRFPTNTPEQYNQREDAAVLQAYVGDARNQKWALTQIPVGKALRTRIIKEDSIVYLYVYIGDVVRR